jgi:hypothetical protein
MMGFRLPIQRDSNSQAVARFRVEGFKPWLTDFHPPHPSARSGEVGLDGPVTRHLPGDSICVC